MAFSSFSSVRKIIDEKPCHLLLWGDFFHRLWRRALLISIIEVRLSYCNDC